MGDKKKLLEELYEAFNRRDVETVLAHLHPDVDWPDQLEHRRLRGRDAVRAYWTAQFKLITPEHAPIRYVETPDGGMTAHVHQRVANLDGKVWSDGMVEHHYAFRDGLISKLTVASP